MRFRPTSRLLLLLLLPAVVLVAATWVAALFWLAVLLFLFLAAAFAADVVISTKDRNISVHRERPAMLSIGQENEIVLTLSNDGTYPFAFRLRDEAPDDFEVKPLVMEGRAGIRSSITLSYFVKPFRRGAYRFGKIIVRHLSAFRLAELDLAIEAGDEVPVYPDILELRKHTLTTRGEEDVVERRSGPRGATEFERLREYQPDDEFRYIDWNATARIGKPIVRQYQTQRNQNVLLAYDLGRHMTTQYGDLLKVDHAINSGVVLGWTGSQRGENIGLLTFTDQVRAYLRPRAGRAQFRRILDVLHKAEPELVQPDYRNAFQYLAARNPRRSLVVIFTDISDLSGAEELLQGVSLLQPKHLPLVVLLMDPSLRRFGEIYPRSKEDMYRLAVAQQLIEERTLIVRRLEARGIDVIDVPAEQLSVALLDSYLKIKTRAAL